MQREQMLFGLRHRYNPMMGIIFEELIRRFNEALNETPASTSRRALSSI
jgi:hypothetical protein